MADLKNYYLGLDIGTDSVGYAVTDEDYNLLKFRGEPMWGTHLFEAANQASERRAFRTARRRLDRRQHRVKLLQELFAVEIGKLDPRFFLRQAESALYPEDKAERNALFNDADFTDADYHERYPTIHHLIHELMTSDAPHDVRLVYLACAWLVAHRGHFLSNIGTDNIEAVTDFSAVYQDFRDYLIQQGFAIPWPEAAVSGIENAMKLEAGVTKKAKALAAACFGNRKPPKGGDEDAINCDALFRAMAGGKVTAEDLFNKPAYAELENKSFSLDMDDETLERLYAELDEDAEYVRRIKAIYDWSLLVRVLDAGEDGGPHTLSRAKIRVYEQHQSDLRWLKAVIRKYAPGQYEAVFRDDTPANYVAYTGHGDGEKTKRVNQELFCKFLRGILKGVQPDEADAAEFNAALARIEDNTFMPKQKNGDNRVIPHQLYWYELDALLRRAEGYLPFLAEADESGITVSEKIRSVFLFRVPYYVGPLGHEGDERNHWVVRKPGRILPWNFDEMVDRDASEQAFIKNLIGSCTYLPGEKVLPRESMLYHRFSVLNEINKIKVNGTPITVAQKQAIYDGLFARQPKVTQKRLRDFMIAGGMMGREDELTGVDAQIKSNLKPNHDFKRLLDSGALTEADAEAIIEHRTFTEDKSRFRRWLIAEYPALPEADIRYICSLSYRDFGRLSRRLLAELEGIDYRTGEITTVIRALWETNDNLMEILQSDRYNFKKVVEEEQQRFYQEHPQSIAERLQEMYVPAAVRRPVLRALEVVKEVVKARGYAPERFFIEVTRGATPEQKGKRTLTRKSQLMALYAQCRDEDVAPLRAQLEAMGEAADARLQSERLYLYYLQLGRCMYTGKPIDLDRLMNDKLYDVDHIYPQSLVKDDSIQNNKALVISEENGRKGNGLVRPEVQRAMRPFWEHLKSLGLVNDEKLRRLTRVSPFTADEKWGFISRQLTETSQSTKAVATLLNQLYPDSEIVYVKARLASDFRQEFDRIKSRDFNDLHHAKDAYLNIVVGNVYHERFSKSWFNPDMEYTLNMKPMFTRPVVCRGKTVWGGAPMLERVKATLLRNNAHFTRYAFRRQGGLFDQQPVKKGPGLVPLKQGLDTEKYGGYNKAAISFFALAAFTAGKKRDVMFLPVELRIADAYLADPDFRQRYALEKIAKITGKPVQRVEFPMGDRIIRINTVLSLDGFRACITGNSSYGSKIVVSGQISFSADYEIERYIKRLRSLVDKLSNNPRYVFSTVTNKVTKEENQRLYDLYLYKLQNTIYSRRPNHPLEAAQKGRNKFLKLTEVEQASVLLSLHTVFGRLAGGTDLSLIGGVKKAAASQKSAYLSNWQKVNSDVRIIDQSATGLWETRSRNLLELL